MAHIISVEDWHKDQKRVESGEIYQMGDTLFKVVPSPCGNCSGCIFEYEPDDCLASPECTYDDGSCYTFTDYHEEDDDGV